MSEWIMNCCCNNLPLIVTHPNGSYFLMGLVLGLFIAVIVIIIVAHCCNE